MKADELSNFTGSEHWYKHPLSGGMLYTDGIMYIAKNGGNGNGAYWLIDAIGSYQPQLRKEEFQLWILKVNLEAKTAVLTCQSDSNMPNLVEQKIEYTDFELPELTMYVENGVLYLPSER